MPVEKRAEARSETTPGNDFHGVREGRTVIGDEIVPPRDVILPIHGSTDGKTVNGRSENGNRTKVIISRFRLFVVEEVALFDSYLLDILFVGRRTDWLLREDTMICFLTRKISGFFELRLEILRNGN